MLEVCIQKFDVHFTISSTAFNGPVYVANADCALRGTGLSRDRDRGDLLPFSPDLELHKPPPVLSPRPVLTSADALLIASPEDAHGVSGVMRNAMDWLVASGVFVHKAVVLWNSSPHTSIALAALREILIVISARLVNEAGLEVLIKSTGAADPPVNSDPVAVQTAPLALQSALTLREHSPDSNCQPSTHSLIATPATLIRPPNGNAAA